jgi:RimJ/RimL family protein N-acetyltransferase
VSAEERPVGAAISKTPSGTVADGRPLPGRYVRLEKASARDHAADLFQSITEQDPEGRIWTYLGYGPFVSYEAFHEWLAARERSEDPLFYAFVLRASGKPSGMGSFMRMDGANGVIEIGHIWMTPVMQRTREASEAIFLMMRHAFDDLSMRRLEWKCDALNGPSRRAAERFGFTFEGVFRQHMIVKGRNRDTAWYAIIDRDWPAIRTSFDDWLKPDNFASDGRQKSRLGGRRGASGGELPRARKGAGEVGRRRAGPRR